jgi:hypothetical protein
LKWNRGVGIIAVARREVAGGLFGPGGCLERTSGKEKGGMSRKSYLRRKPGVWRKWLPLLMVVLMACGASMRLTDCAEAVAAETPSQEGAASPRVTAGPEDTDFNSHGYKVCKVVRMERSLNALGIAALFGKANKVGKYVELPKRLEPSDRGEHFLITWKYSGKKPSPKTMLKVEYKLANEEKVESVTREYSDLKKGKRRLRIEHTGENYRRRGRIEYWRVSVFADGQLVARKESFLWPLFQGEEKIAAEGKPDS